LIRDQQVPPEGCLAPTFTRRAAAELGERLATLLGAELVAVTRVEPPPPAVPRPQAAAFGLDPEQARRSTTRPGRCS